MRISRKKKHMNACRKGSSDKLRTALHSFTARLIDRLRFAVVALRNTLRFDFNDIHDLFIYSELTIRHSKEKNMPYSASFQRNV